MGFIFTILFILFWYFLIREIIKNERGERKIKVAKEKTNFSQIFEKLGGILNMKKYSKFIKIGIIVLIFLIIILSSLKSVPTGTVGVKTRFGAVQKSVINEGMNLKIPFIEKIVLINCKTQKIETTSEGSTRDMQTVDVSIAVNYNVIKETANSLYQNVGLNYEEIIIKPAMLESIKATMAQYTAEELITKRAEISENIKQILITKISDSGFSVTGFNITDINFSDSYNQAIEKKAVAQQEVETAKANLEKQQIENNQKISVAETEAKVMALQNAQITENTLKLKELENQEKFINKWNGSLPSTMLSDGASSLFNINK